MDTYIREIQLANMLGYTEPEDFRRAVSRGEVPPPSRYLAPRKRKPIWSKAAIDEWRGKHERKTASDSFMDMASKVA